MNGLTIALCSLSIFCVPQVMANSQLPFEYQSAQHIKAQLNTQVVNINSANVNQLKKLVGIDNEKANNIVMHRGVNGHFTSLTQFSAVEGVGGKLFELNIHNISL